MPSVPRANTDETFEGQLRRLLDRYDQRKDEHQSKMAAIAREEEAFLEEFAKFRELTAYPLFETVAQHLRERGHDFSVEQKDYDVSEYGSAKDALIAITIYPAGMPRHSRAVHEFPAFSITASKGTRLVRLHRNVVNPGGGSSLTLPDELELHMVTAEVVQRELLKLLGEVFGISRA